MTNEEKAREIAESADGYIYMIAKIMAEWKDQQFKEYLEKKRHTELVLSIANVEDSEIWNRHDGKREILGEIIKELFPEQEQDNSNNDE